MNAKMPPVPPANQSDKSPVPSREAAAEAKNPDKPPPDTDSQDRQGNIHQNTTHQGYQQDR